MYATLITASQTWRGVKMTPKIRRVLDQMRETMESKEKKVA